VGQSGRLPQGEEKSLWWPWTYADEEQTIFRVSPRRDRDAVQEVLGCDFEGVLVSDCFAGYDDATPVQHKCYRPQAISRAQADCKAEAGESSSYLQAVRGLLIGATGLKKANSDLSSQQVQSRREALEDSADRLLKPDRTDSLTEIEDKIRRRLEKQRDPLFVFLDHEKVPATHNRAERQLRPAVIRRKLSCGNRTPWGAEAPERTASVVETCAQQGRSVLDYLTATMSLSMGPLPLH